MRLCTHCGKAVASDSAQFCGGCGQKLTAPDSPPSPPKAPHPLCPACGALLQENSAFCGACGTAAAQNSPKSPTAPLPVLPKEPEVTPAYAAPAAPPKGLPFFKKKGPRIPKPRGRFSIRKLFRKAVSLVMILGILYGAGLFLLSLEHKLGLWENFTFQRTLDAWKKDKGAMAQEKPLLEAVNSLADALDSGNLDGAMGYVLPGRQEMIRKDLETLRQDPAALSALTAALRQASVTFIGTADENPEEAPFRAQVSIPADKLTHTLTWVMINERWVVTRL